MGVWRRTRLAAVATALVTLLGSLYQLKKLHHSVPYRTTRRREEAPQIPISQGVPSDDALCSDAFGGMMVTPTAPPAISLIAASSNRTASVLSVLSSWLAIEGLDELVLVDWGSHPPLRAALPTALDRCALRVRRTTDWRRFRLRVSPATRAVLSNLLAYSSQARATSQRTV